MTARRNSTPVGGSIGTKQGDARAVDAARALKRTINRDDDATSSRDDWQSRAACRDADPDMFIPTILTRGKAAPGALTYAEKIEHALALCAQCPVTCECLTFALEHDEVGVWGNTTEADRTALRRSGRIRERCPCCQSTKVVQFGGFLGRECLVCNARWR